MKVKNYVVSVAEKARGHMDHMAVKVTAVTMGLMTAPTMLAFASDAGGNTSYLSGEVMDSISKAFGNLAVTATGVVAIAVVTGCSVIGMSAGAKYAMKKIKGTLSSAA